VKGEFMEQIKLGVKVKDKVSGLEGIATSITEFIYGCRRIGVSPQELKDGKPMEESIIDEPQLDIIGDGIRASAEEQDSKKKRERNYGDRFFVPTKHQPNLAK